MFSRPAGAAKPKGMRRLGACNRLIWAVLPTTSEAVLIPQAGHCEIERRSVMTETSPRQLKRSGTSPTPKPRLV